MMIDNQRSGGSGSFLNVAKKAALMKGDMLAKLAALQRRRQIYAQQLYSQCTEQTQANGLDRNQAIALLEANGVHENERLIDGVFATCDAHATGRLKLAAFTEFYSVVSMRTRQRERREKRLKLAEERAAMHADGGYMMQ